VTYSREELDWIEAEWALHLHGRQAFLSREDYQQVQEWEAMGVPTDLIVQALGSFFERRAKRAHPRAFVALSQVAKDVAKAMKLRESLLRAGPAPAAATGWKEVREPLRSEPRARAAFEAWAAQKAASPAPDAPGFLEHFDQEREAFLRLLELATEALGSAAEELRAGLRTRLAEAKLEEGSSLWKRAWNHHWGRVVCETWGIPQ
jgi:hypothetical protein